MTGTARFDNFALRSGTTAICAQRTAESTESVEKLEFPHRSQIQETAGSLDGNCLGVRRTDRSCRVRRSYMPCREDYRLRLTRRARKRDSRGGSISEFFNTIDVKLPFAISADRGFRLFPYRNTAPPRCVRGCGRARPQRRRPRSSRTAWIIPLPAMTPSNHFAENPERNSKL